MKTPPFQLDKLLKHLKRLSFSRPLTVKRKIHYSLSFLTALVAIVGLTTLLMQRKVTSALLYITEETAPAVIALEQITTNASRMQSEVLSYVVVVNTMTLDFDDMLLEQEVDEYREAKDSLTTWLATYIEHARNNENPSERILAERLQQGLQRFIRACEALLNLDGNVG